MRTRSGSQDPTSRTRRLEGTSRGGTVETERMAGTGEAERATDRLPRAADPTAPLADAERLPRPVVLGRYLLQRRLGAGGFGVVWLAFDEKLQREVAVKVIPREAEEAGSKATREARAAARLNHPGIVALYELLADEDSIYLVSELVGGRTLAELSSAGALADRDVARIGIALCDALAHAHERGVIHRDVKPQNVMVVAEPAAGAGFAKLTDFGVARLGGGEDASATGGIVGTLAYMAPEQADGAPADATSDVYALALTLYEALTGQNPVRGRTPAETARRLGSRLPALRAQRPELPDALGRAIDAALEPQSELRPSVASLGAAIADAEGQLSDEGGLVEPATLERVGLPRAPRRRLFPHVWRRESRPATSLLEPGMGEDTGTGASRRAALVGRVAAGLAGGGLVLGALELLGPAPPVSATAAAAVAAAAMFALPRLGWIAAALAVCGWLASPEADRQGSALVLAAMLAPIPLLLPRAGKLWSVPALAPLLGAIGVAPLFVAVAGLPATLWRRCGLGAAGFLWLAGAELLSGDSLLFGSADGTQPPEAWETSLTGAASDALYPAVSSPALAPVAVWALFAAVLPLLVRGRSFALDLLGAVAWAGGLVLAHAALASLLVASVELPEARGAVAGAALGGLVAVIVAALRGPASSPPSHGLAEPGVP